MRCSAALRLAACLALFGFSLSLTCYNCPEGHNGTCPIQRECSRLEDSCLILSSQAATYTSCISYTDCNFRTLSVRFPVTQFTYTCCLKALCNETKEKKGVFQRLLGMLG